jgi:iron complex transport system substrate-binding protein
VSWRSKKPVLFVFILLLIAGCSRTSLETTSTRRQFTDGLGRSVNIAFPPQRIISLAPSVTESLFALDLESRIVGVTSYCDYPAAARQKEKVGDTIHPNLEKIISLRPDLVVISTASQLEALTRRLDQLAIPVFVTNPRSVREVVAWIRTLGGLTGTDAPAEALASNMERRVDDIERRLGGRPRTKTLYVLQTGPLITVGGKTFINDLIELAGGTSISSSETADYPQFSREAVTARAPDVIIAPSSHGTEIVAEQALLKDFAGTPAITYRRILRVDPDLVDRPGPRLIDGLEQLARGLHPEVMK